MEIKWANVAALGLLVVALVILVTHPEEIGAVLGSTGAAGAGHTLSDPTLGLIALGMILVVIVGVVRLLAASRRP